MFCLTQTVDDTVLAVTNANTSNYKWHKYSQISFKQQNFNRKKEQFSFVLALNN